jgi:alkylhydroperoxidase/carboxymuconolactone decarboxylase family protein YurZ
MSNSYYDSADLGKFGKINDYQKEMGEKFFGWYAEVFKDSALTAKEKSLIALAVSHAVQVAAAIRGGASLVHGVQMMNKVKEIAM